MMKLLKYDLKRNATTFLSVGAVLIVLQLILSITGNIRDWDPRAIISLTIVLYTFTGMLSVILVLRTYSHNIKAYSRRLLPQRSIGTILSVMILSWIMPIVLIGIIVVHAVLYNYFTGYLNADEITNILNVFPDALRILFLLFWWYTYLFATLILSSTISASIRGKVGTWLGIISFFVIQSGLGWLEVKLLGITDGGMKMVVVSNGTEGAEISTTNGGQLIDSNLLLIDWRTVAIEFIFIALILYATVLILDRKEQV